MTGPRGRGRGWIGWAAAGVLLVALVVFLLVGANRPADPSLTPARVAVAGFGQIEFRIDRDPSAIRCALLAETPGQRGRGLMNRTDLGGFDAMVFRFPGDTTVWFHMQDTPVPLSIAWFDSAGRFVSSQDMLPCLDQDACPHYDAAAPYRYALEVPQGGLSALGIGPGSHLVLGGSCS